jgi:hypothetical protein
MCGNLISDIKGGIYTEDVREKGAEEDIWQKRYEVTEG